MLAEATRFTRRRPRRRTHDDPVPSLSTAREPRRRGACPDPPRGGRYVTKLKRAAVLDATRGVVPADHQVLDAGCDDGRSLRVLVDACWPVRAIALDDGADMPGAHSQGRAVLVPIRGGNDSQLIPSDVALELLLRLDRLISLVRG
jgi:hypothetical protein